MGHFAHPAAFGKCRTYLPTELHPKSIRVKEGQSQIDQVKKGPICNKLIQLWGQKVILVQINSRTGTSTTFCLQLPTQLVSIALQLQMITFTMLFYYSFFNYFTIGLFKMKEIFFRIYKFIHNSFEEDGPAGLVVRILSSLLVPGFFCGIPKVQTCWGYLDGVSGLGQ